ncbi:MAG: hypothetical protein P8X85_08390 [Desulfobacterales bacterium]
MLKKFGINVALPLQFLKYVLGFYDPMLHKRIGKKIEMLEMVTGAESGKAETFVFLIFQKKVEGIGSK